MFIFRITYNKNDRYLYDLRHIFGDAVQSDFIPELNTNGYILDDDLGDFLEISNLFHIDSSEHIKWASQTLQNIKQNNGYNWTIFQALSWT